MPKSAAKRVYADDTVTLFLAPSQEPFRPWPAEDDLPRRVEEGEFFLECPPRQICAFQIIVASKADIVISSVEASGLPEKCRFTCLSTEGEDSAGNAYKQVMPVEANKPWPFWCLVCIDTVGTYRLELTLNTSVGALRAPMTFKTYGAPSADRGFEDNANLSRLVWLNSRAGIDRTIPAPFTPIERDGLSMNIVGRRVTLDAGGCPEQIYSHFTGNNSVLSAEGKPILRAPLSYEVLVNERAVKFDPKRLTFTEDSPDVVSWRAESEGEGILLTVEGALEFDGTLTLYAEISAKETTEAEVRFMHLPAPGYDGLFIGLGIVGGRTPESHQWKWARDVRQDAYWIGSVNGGLRVKPRDRDMEESYVNLYYRHGPRNLPVNWVNAGKGGFSMERTPEASLRFESGLLTIEAQPKVFGVELMISPFKLVDQGKHFGTRYYHGNRYPEEQWARHASESNATHINIHHGNDSYPFINYPIYDPEPIRRIVSAAHAEGLGVKPYYTVRELTSQLPEFWAMRSLRQEIFPRPAFDFDGIEGQGGIDDRLARDVGAEVIPAWKHVFREGRHKGVVDASIITNPMSRLANFHVAGLKWMLTEMDIDGIYIDDVGYGRTVMRRIRRLFDRHKPKALIDLHSWNHHEDHHGAAWGHNALIYAQLMPYVDSLWLGEGFDYDHTSADYIMVEISGLPFGLMGEMLENGGNLWRGMLYGMTNRFPYHRGTGPVGIWKLRDAFGFDGVKMLGYWDPENPVKADRAEIYCTVYRNEGAGRDLCCFANFGDAAADFLPLGLADGAKGRLPAVEGMQEAASWDGITSLHAEPGSGIILWVDYT